MNMIWSIHYVKIIKFSYVLPFLRSSVIETIQFSFCSANFHYVLPFLRYCTFFLVFINHSGLCMIHVHNKIHTLNFRWTVPIEQHFKKFHIYIIVFRKVTIKYCLLLFAKQIINWSWLIHTSCMFPFLTKYNHNMTIGVQGMTPVGVQNIGYV